MLASAVAISASTEAGAAPSNSAIPTEKPSPSPETSSAWCRRSSAPAIASAPVRVGQHHELVAAEAADDVRGAERRAQPGREATQRAVAGGVAAAVVDGLEAVEVEVEQGRGLVAARADGQRVGRRRQEAPAIGQPGELVLGGQLARRQISLGDQRQVRQERALVGGQRADRRVVQGQGAERRPVHRAQRDLGHDRQAGHASAVAVAVIQGPHAGVGHAEQRLGQARHVREGAGATRERGPRLPVGGGEDGRGGDGRGHEGAPARRGLGGQGRAGAPPRVVHEECIVRPRNSCRAPGRDGARLRAAGRTDGRSGRAPWRPRPRGSWARRGSRANQPGAG
jgi:hypothetical protein